MRMNQEQASGSGADKQRDEHTCKPPPLYYCRGPVGDVAHKEYDGCGRSGRKHALYTKRPTRGALAPHREPPRAEENVGYIDRWLAVRREPDGQENSMCDQR